MCHTLQALGAQVGGERDEVWETTVLSNSRHEMTVGEWTRGISKSAIVLFCKTILPWKLLRALCKGLAPVVPLWYSSLWLCVLFGFPIVWFLAKVFEDCDELCKEEYRR